MTLISTATELRYSDYYGMMNYAEFLKFEADVKAGVRSSNGGYAITTSETTWS